MEQPIIPPNTDLSGMVNRNHLNFFKSIKRMKKLKAIFSPYNTVDIQGKVEDIISKLK